MRRSCTDNTHGQTSSFVTCNQSFLFSFPLFSHTCFPKAPPSLPVPLFSPSVTGPAACLVQSPNVLLPFPILSPTTPQVLTPSVCKVNRESPGQGLLLPDHGAYALSVTALGKAGILSWVILVFSDLGYTCSCPVITVSLFFFVFTETNLQSHDLTPLGSWIRLLIPAMKIAVSGKMCQTLGSCMITFIEIINLEIFSKQVAGFEDLCGLSFGYRLHSYLQLIILSLHSSCYK